MSLKTIQVGPVENRLGISGRYVRLIAAAEPVEVRIVGRAVSSGQRWQYETILFAGLGLSFNDLTNFPSECEAIEIRSTVPQKIQLWTGAAAVDDNRTDGLRVTSDGVRELKSYRAEVSSEASEIAPAEGGRRRVTIQVESGVLYWGGEDVTEQTGMMLGQGDSAEVETTAAVYAVSSAGAVVRLLDEVN